VPDRAGPSALSQFAAGFEDRDVSTISHLSQDECEQLLRAGVFGRIVVTCDERIEVIPVNYATVGDALLVRTDPGSLLDRYGDDAALVFEVDHVTYDRWHGWSVVARGVGERVAEDELTDVERAAPGPPPWVRRDNSTWLRLRWQELSGRRVGSGWDPLAEMPVRRQSG
jgi:nitroimidazol reductase NimA-like FMN-containing flavoprotein (pyridoxamine 5'-phosphate oxidase superfamily)